MSRVSPLLSTFNAGEWSPKLYGRVDLAKYGNACRRLRNMIPLVQGAATRRLGTRFMAPTRGNAVGVLIPFEFSTEQAYVIEATEGWFRFYMNRGQIVAGAAAYEVAHPYLAAELAGIRWTQSADVLYLVHPIRQIRKLSRSGHTAWTLSVFVAQDGPYLDVNRTAVTITPSATSGAVTLTASAALFAASDVGRLVRLKHGTTWGYAQVTAVTSSTVVSATVLAAFGAATAVQDWRLGAWSDALGWPAAVTFYEERLFFGGTAARPQSVWGSMSGDYENFAPTTTDDKVFDDNAVTYTLSDDRVNAIRWLSAGETLAVGTAGGESIIRASTLNEALTPSNVTAKRQTTNGVRDCLPVRIGQAVLYAQRAGKRVLEFGYQFERDSYSSADLSVLAGHITRRGIVQMVWQQEPWATLWAVLADGTLAALTYEREQDVWGWTRHDLGGTNAKVLSLAVIPGTDQDELWMIVERTIGGVTRRYVEVMEYEFWPEGENDKDGMFFVDCGLSYTGAPATEISGLDHLEGETVQVVADGAVHPDRVVTGGAITLDQAASVVHVGLGFESELVTLNLEAGANDGSAVGKRKRVDRAVAKFWATLGCLMGPFGGALDEVLFREGHHAMDASPPLFTGDKAITFPNGWQREVAVQIVQRQPLPLTVLAIVPRTTTTEG